MHWKDEALQGKLSGDLFGTALFLSILVVCALPQIAAKKIHPFFYWATIVASTGTTIRAADVSRHRPRPDDNCA